MIRTDLAEDSATQLLRQFLFMTNLNCQTKTRFNYLQKMRFKIAAMYRAHIQALESRTRVMYDVFDTEIGYLVKYFSKKRKGGLDKKHKRLVVKLNCIDRAIKERVLLLYMNRMKFYYTVKTLKWFLLYRSEQYSIEDVSTLIYLKSLFHV